MKPQDIQSTAPAVRILPQHLNNNLLKFSLSVLGRLAEFE